MNSNQPLYYGIIPARYESVRFPGKPLVDICGQPMFKHVYQRALRCKAFHRVVLATDDQRIFDAATIHDVDVVMTRSDHPSGTDRVLEAAQKIGVQDHAVVVNIQGDEPALAPDLLTHLIAPFKDPAVQVTTPIRAIALEEAQNPDRVKVVYDRTQKAIYFSRAMIPYPRAGQEKTTYYGHIGLYAFRMTTLKTFVALGAGRLEAIEKLEQLRLLENNIPIHVVLTTHRSIGVDRPEDLDAVRAILKEES